MHILTARSRLIVSVTIGLLAGLAMTLFKEPRYIPLVIWDVTALSYTLSVLTTVLGFTEQQTKSHALSDNPGSVVADILLIITSIASLVGVTVLIFQGSSAGGVEKAMDIVIGLVSVVASWAVVHTLFMLKYARMYYGDPEGGVDFNDQSKPKYSDFAYLAFTVGMTFQVSDTELKTKQFRSTVLRQAMLAYVFGTVIIATTINTVVTLSSQ